MLALLITLFKQRSIQVILIVFLYIFLAPFLSMEVHRSFYTVSLFIKDLLLWILPITIGFFIAHTISCFEKKAPLFILSLFIFEALSNFLCIWYSYGCGHLASHYLHPLAPYHLNDTFAPLWRLPFTKPVWWTADKGTFVGLSLGLISSFKFSFLKIVIRRGKEVSEKILTRFFSRLIPIFILGFIARIYKSQLLTQMLSQYTEFFVWLLACLVLYIIFLFLVGTGFSLRKCFGNIKNLLPAMGVAFSSGCSLSTMPWTIEGTAKNLKNPPLAKAVIPATTNIQQIGDCIINSFLCFLIYLHFNGHPPSLTVWLSFVPVFVLARFATAAVIGGAIFVMLPIYESYLGFNAEMIAIILAFNVILDPLVTCSNVIANGALCRVFEKVWLYSLHKLSYYKKTKTI